MIKDNKLATVHLICVDASHVERGREIPDGYGALKLNGRRWAYCSAARPESPTAAAVLKKPFELDDFIRWVDAAASLARADN